MIDSTTTSVPDKDQEGLDAQRMRHSRIPAYKMLSSNEEDFGTAIEELRQEQKLEKRYSKEYQNWTPFFTLQIKKMEEEGYSHQEIQDWLDLRT